MESSESDKYSLEFNIDGIYALKSVIDYAIEKWPGAPARPWEEQEFLWGMRDTLQRCLLEHSFHNMELGDK